MCPTKYRDGESERNMASEVLPAEQVAFLPETLLRASVDLMLDVPALRFDWNRIDAVLARTLPFATMLMKANPGGDRRGSASLSSSNIAMPTLLAHGELHQAWTTEARGVLTSAIASNRETEDQDADILRALSGKYFNVPTRGHGIAVIAARETAYLAAVYCQTTKQASERHQ